MKAELFSLAPVSEDASPVPDLSSMKQLSSRVPCRSKDHPSTKEIHRLGDSEGGGWELREALNREGDVHLESQPACLLPVILKVNASDLQLEELLVGFSGTTSVVGFILTGTPS